MQYEAQNYSVSYYDGTGCRCGNCVSSLHLHKYEVALLFPAMLLFFPFPFLASGGAGGMIYRQFAVLLLLNWTSSDVEHLVFRALVL
jgi:hypothetical protein